MTRAGALALALVLGSCGSSNNVTAQTPQSCQDACGAIYDSCSRVVNLGAGTVDKTGCQNACAGANQAQAKQWTCVDGLITFKPGTREIDAVDCTGLDGCLLPIACPGAASLVLTCVGQSQSSAALASCQSAPTAFRPCLDCISSTSCPAMAAGCAAACGFPTP